MEGFPPLYCNTPILMDNIAKLLHLSTDSAPLEKSSLTSQPTLDVMFPLLALIPSVIVCIITDEIVRPISILFTSVPQYQEQMSDLPHMLKEFC